MNEEVSFEIAKLLKEAGFDKPSCNLYHFKTNELMYKPINGIVMIKIDNHNLTNHISAPTIAEVIMWIYEKYKVWVVINITISSDWYFELYDLNSKRNAEIKVDANLYNSPSEAYEAAIKHYLTNNIKP